MKYFILLLWLLPFTSYGQLYPVKGKVINEEKSPLPGATITIQRTGEIILADTDGTFLIRNTLATDTFTVQSTGYMPARIPNNTSGILTVTLNRSITTLSEVIINTGYETIPKERSTGAFGTIDQRLLNQQVSYDVLSRLEGIVSGLAIDKITNKPGITIRGLSTINGPGGPLIIVDNFPYKGDINNINPNEVENITILKDAAAASIWGAQAGNGVIVITTKTGSFNKPLSINITSSYTLHEKPDLYYLRSMSPSEYIDAEIMLFDKGYKFSDTASSSRPDFTPVYEILFKKRKGLLSSAEADQQINRLRQTDLREALNQYMYRQAIGRQLGIGLDGGNTKSSYHFFVGMDYNTTELDADYRRISLVLKNSYQILPKLKLTTGIQYTHTRSVSGRPSYQNLRAGTSVLPLYTPLADENGNPLPVTADIRQTFKDTAGRGKLLDWNFYPLEDYKFTRSVMSQGDIVVNARLAYNILPSVRAQVQYQFEQEQGLMQKTNGINSYYTRNLVNRFTVINPTTGQVTYNVPKGAVINRDDQSLQAHQLRGQLNFNRRSRLHEIHVLAGAEISQTKNNQAGYYVFGVNEETGTTTNIDNVNRYPDYVRGTLSTIPGSTSLGYSLNRFVSFFTNSAYTFKQKYTVSLSARKDASNLFGLSTNDKWNPLWSAGMGWNISREKFYHWKALPELQFRATYGASGNIDQGKAAVNTISYNGVSATTLTPYSLPNNYSNPSLRWEKVKMINLAADFASIHNRISGSIDFYIKKAEDLYGNTPMDYTTGVGSSIVKNVASMKGTGIDATINVAVIDKKFKWDVSTIFNYYRDKVTHYYLNSLRASSFLNIAVTAVEGQPVYGVYSYYWGGLDDNGNPQGFIDGQLSTDYNALTGSSVLVSDLKYHGPLFPVMTGAVGNHFAWRGFTLDIRVNYKLGYYYRLPSIYYTNLYSSGIGDNDFNKRWQKRGDELITNVPSMLYPNPSGRDVLYNYSEVLVRRADHLRLQYINAGYTFGKRTLSFKSLRLFMTVANMGIIWRANKDYMDPDYPSTTLPPTRSWSAGINATF